jgi:hypothetical protein
MSSSLCRDLSLGDRKMTGAIDVFPAASRR